MLLKVSVSDHDREKNRKYSRRWTGTLQRDTRGRKKRWLWELGRERGGAVTECIRLAGVGSGG